MPRAKRSLEEVDPNAQTGSSKSRKENENRKRSLRSSGNVSDDEDTRSGKENSKSTSKKRSTGKATSDRSPKVVKSTGKSSKSPPAQSKSNAREGPKNADIPANKSNDIESGKKQAKDESSKDGDKKENHAKLPPYEYIVGQPPLWDRDDQYEGEKKEKRADMYGEMMKDLEPYLFKPLEQKPDHEWPIMRGSMLRYVNGIWDSNVRNPEHFDMYIYNDFQGYGLHEVVENFLVDYRKEFIKKDSDRNIKEMWVIVAGLIHYLKLHYAIEYAFSGIDDGERFVHILKLIGITCLSMLDILDSADQLKAEAEFKDLALIMKMYIIWGQEWDGDTWDHVTEAWSEKILKYAQDHSIDLSRGPPALATETIKVVEERAAKQKTWPKAGPDRWGFKKAFDSHNRSFGADGKGVRLGGQAFDITKMSKADRKQYSFDKKDPLADVPAKALKEGRLLVGSLE